jgi:hypothetical protein
VYLWCLCLHLLLLICAPRAPLFRPPTPHSALIFPSVLFPSPLRYLFASMHDANTLSSQTPTRRGPCSFWGHRPSTTSNATSSSVTTTHDRDAYQAQHHSTSIATLRTKARLKPKRSTTRTTTRGLSSSTTAPSVLSLRIRCSHRPGPHTAVEVVYAPHTVCMRLPLLR